MMDEPRITVNGVTLSVGQAMTVRVALTSFVSEMQTEGLGNEVLRMMLSEQAQP